MFDHKHYVPCLRWKQGEYQALMKLPQATRREITPLIEVAEIGWDFESGEEKNTIDEHLANFATRVRIKWGRSQLFVDLKLIQPQERMTDGRHPLTFVFDDLRANQVRAIPVTGIDREKAYQEATINAAKIDRNGICVRVTLEQLARSRFATDFASLLDRLRVRPENLDLVLDLETPSFRPLDGFTKMVRAMISKLAQLDRFRTYTICGTAFPKTMGELDRGDQQVPRDEWLFYKRFQAGLTDGERKPTFGDYAIAHPEVLQMDMRLVKPAASIRYTIDDAWYVIKGGSVRANGYKQYHKHCATLLASGLFMGDQYSEGDSYIRRCAQRNAKSGNLTTWRWVGTNHHIHKVVADIANLNVP